jgi:hypothetical protein
MEVFTAFEPIVSNRIGKVNYYGIRRILEAKFGTNINFSENRTKDRYHSDLRKVYILACNQLSINIDMAIAHIGMAGKSAYLSLRTAKMLMNDPFIKKTLSELLSELKTENKFHE